MEYNYYNKKSIWKWIAIYLIIGVVAYGLIYYFFIYKNNKYVPNDQNIDQATDLDIKNWNEYTNPEGGFILKYPSSWKIDDKTSGGSLKEGPPKTVTFSGSQGQFKIMYGTGFGGMCQEGYEQFLIGSEKFDVCHDIIDDVEYWDISAKDLGRFGLGMSIIVNRPYISNRDIVVNILSTLQFLSRPREADAWKVYTNNEHGFELRFTDEWKNYRVYKKKETHLNDSYSIEFKVPIKDQDYGDLSGYVTPFAISIYPKAVWAEIQSIEQPNPIYLAENSSYVFGYWQWQDIPKELRDINFQISNLISNFKLIKKDETADWKTYRDDKYGFEFQYPPSYSFALGECGSGEKDCYWGFVLTAPNKERLYMILRQGTPGLDSFKKFAIHEAESSCAASGPSGDTFCEGYDKILPTNNNFGASAYEIYVKEFHVDSFESRSFTRVKGPIFVISPFPLNKSVKGIIIDDRAEFSDKETIRKIIATFKFVN